VVESSSPAVSRPSSSNPVLESSSSAVGGSRTQRRQKNVRRRSALLVRGSTSSASAHPLPPPVIHHRWHGTGYGVIAAGLHHSVVLNFDGTVTTFGHCMDGQLGLGRFSEREPPSRVPGIINAVCVGAGAFHTAVVLSNGQVLTFGNNDYGQLGDNRFIPSSSPCLVKGITTAVGVVCGDSFTIIVLSTGKTVAFGNNRHGQLDADQHLPGVDSAAAGAYHCVYLLKTGEVCTSGSNTYGQLGSGDGLASLSDIVCVDAGSLCSAAVRSDGKVATWGCGMYGKLGGHSEANEFTPKIVEGITDALSISIQDFHAAILHKDGGVSTIGKGSFRNHAGWLGHGTDIADKLKPHRIVGISDAIAVACGMFHTIIRHADGRVSTCGYGLALGHPSDEVRVPTLIPGIG
jgi:alpha-tubulin suppressor-like RCC1 family protein